MITKLKVMPFLTAEAVQNFIVLLRIIVANEELLLL